MPAPERSTGVPGKARPSSSAVRRAPTTDERSRWPPHAGHTNAVSTRPHHRQAGGPWGPGSASGPAHTVHRAGRRQSWQDSERQVAPARHLHQHRPLLERLLGGAPGDRGEVGRRHGGVAVGVVALTRDAHRRHRAPQRGARRLDGRQGVARDEVGHRDGAGETGREHPGAVDAGPGEQHLPHVRIGCAGLVEQVVAVVPPGDQAQVAHGSEGSGAGADDHLDVPAQHLEVGGVACLRTLVGREPGVPARAEHVEERGLDAHDVSVVGHDDNRTAAALDGSAGRLGEQHRPVAVGGRGRHDQQGRGGGAAGGEVGQERRPHGIRPPRSGVVGGQDRVPGRLRGERLLRRGVPRWHREPQDVAQRPGIPVGDRTGRREHLGGEHRLG